MLLSPATPRLCAHSLTFIVSDCLGSLSSRMHKKDAHRSSSGPAFNCNSRCLIWKQGSHELARSLSHASATPVVAAAAGLSRRCRICCTCTSSPLFCCCHCHCVNAFARPFQHHHLHLPVHTIHHSAITPPPDHRLQPHFTAQRGGFACIFWMTKSAKCGTSSAVSAAWCVWAV